MTLSNSNTEILETIYKKVALFGLSLISKKPFGFIEINKLVLFIEAEISEIRDDLKEEVTVEFIKRFYNSSEFAKSREKIPETLRVKLDGFIESGLVYYISVVNSTIGRFNYYAWKRWFTKKLSYVCKYLSGFFSSIGKNEVVICDRCKMPIETDLVAFTVEHDSNTVVSQMEVFPGEVPEVSEEPATSVCVPITTALVGSTPIVKDAVQAPIPEKL